MVNIDLTDNESHIILIMTPKIPKIGKIKREVNAEMQFKHFNASRLDILPSMRAEKRLFFPLSHAQTLSAMLSLITSEFSLFILILLLNFMHRKRLRFRCKTKMNKPEAGSKLKYGRQPSYCMEYGHKKSPHGRLAPASYLFIFCFALQK